MNFLNILFNESAKIIGIGLPKTGLTGAGEGIGFGLVLYKYCVGHAKYLDLFLLASFITFLSVCSLNKIPILESLEVYIFANLVSFSFCFFVQTNENLSLKHENGKKLDFLSTFILDNKIIQNHLQNDFFSIDVLIKGSIFFLSITNINKELHLFQLSSVFLIWVYYVILVYLVIRTLIIFLANSHAKLKIIGACLNCIVGATTTVGASLEFHKMATDSSAAYPIIAMKPVYYWQKYTLGYQCLSREDLKLGKSFLEKYPNQVVPTQLNGFIDRELCIAKIKKSSWF